MTDDLVARLPTDAAARRLPEFIKTLRINRAARRESVYASDNVYALLDACDAAEARVRELEGLLSDMEALKNTYRDDCLAAEARLSTIEAEAIERCAGMAEGEIYRECYRAWPWWGAGNVSDEGLLASFGKDLATAIRKLGQEVK